MGVWASCANLAVTKRSPHPPATAGGNTGISSIRTGNAACLHHLQVCHSKVEELRLDSEGERVDVLVSEPMGTLLVNERMLETYLYARDHFLKPGGKMFPVGAIRRRGEGELTPLSSSPSCSQLAAQLPCDVVSC